MVEISKEKYLHALALFFLARKKQEDAEEIETELNKLFGEENGTHLSDEIYSREIKDVKESFDICLRNMGCRLVIEKPPQ